MSTKRTALVAVRNETGNPIVAVSVLHKYSNNYKNQKQWPIIHNGSHGKGELEVEYNTGAFTTGKDWWLIAWYDAKLETLYYSDPDNFRGIIDALDKVGPGTLGPAVMGPVADLTRRLTDDVFGVDIEPVAKLAKDTTTLLFNSESTTGFKQHILRLEDEGKITEIILHSDGRIALKSRSGDSETKYSKRALK